MCSGTVPWAFLTLSFAFVGCGGSPAAESEPATVACTIVSQCFDRFEVSPNRFVQYYRTWEVEDGHPDISRALIIVHGAGRNAPSSFETGVTVVRSESALDETIVIAPKFQTLDDNPANDEPYWSESGWKRGHLSRTEGPGPRVSSFAVLDAMITRLSSRILFPSMQEIVVAGHSAGGQVAHRYAAGGTPPPNGVSVRYVVANPSTYLFARAERPNPDGDGFVVPDRGECGDYAEWHYGLEDLNSYMSRLDEAEIVENLISRDVTIMVGDRDTGSSQLDVSCGANLQGEHRFARGLNLMAYMDAFFPTHNHTSVVVPNVAHSSRGMFTSSGGRDALFR